MARTRILLGLFIAASWLSASLCGRGALAADRPIPASATFYCTGQTGHDNPADPAQSPARSPRRWSRRINIEPGPDTCPACPWQSRLPVDFVSVGFSVRTPFLREGKAWQFQWRTASQPRAPSLVF